MLRKQFLRGKNQKSWFGKQTHWSRLRLLVRFLKDHSQDQFLVLSCGLSIKLRSVEVKLFNDIRLGTNKTGKY